MRMKHVNTRQRHVVSVDLLPVTEVANHTIRHMFVLWVLGWRTVSRKGVGAYFSQEMPAHKPASQTSPPTLRAEVRLTINYIY